MYFYDKGSWNSISGIKATVFGGTNMLGALIGSKLTLKGSVCVYPHRDIGNYGDHVFRELKVMADYGYKCSIRLNDFTCPWEVQLTMKDSNVVICTIGA